MSQPNFLSETDIDTLINLLLRSQQSRTREALCLSIGIDPKRLSFLRDSSDADFFLLFIQYLNEIGDTEALCQLCCKELFPIFHKGTHSLILSDIAVKLNCNHQFSQNSSNNKQPTSSASNPAAEFNDNLSNQPNVSKPKSLFTRIVYHKNKLFAVAAILAFGLIGHPVYESLKPSPQLVEDKMLTEKARLVWSETEGKIGPYKEHTVIVKPTNVNLRNFSVEAQFYNPYNGAMENWTYGFAFWPQNPNNNLKVSSFDIWVTSKEKEWRFGGTSRSSNGKLSNLNVSEKGSNKLRLTVKENKAKIFVNDIYIETFDVSDFTNKGDVLLIIKDGISGKSVKYENLKIWSLDN
ncbi:hypothetical protein OGM63_25765 [Plectonema radiosum NIES-515]|uniref:Uncharacterized protein n=1 Tax=Plectonema radiosum NIES-515 TaxID=2986073 RepID=A0ABT3B671_9CYAN|nr:hypothetical protein [Plectonema radiosum]MCV3216871.1 hypothetical protein [Plectonema radiosum NIES-515]